MCAAAAEDTAQPAKVPSSSSNGLTRKSHCSNCLGVETDCITLTRMVLQTHQQDSDGSDLSLLLSSLLTAFKAISSAVRKAGFAQLYGGYGTENVHGDAVQQIDMIANELLMNLLKASFTTCALISEEDDHAVEVSNCPDGKFIVAFDPLDGSCNIDVHVTIGTIFSVWRRKTPVGTPVAPEDLLQTGRELVAAGYAIYGSATIVILSTGRGVNGFTLDPNIGAFVLTHPNMSIPRRGNLYSTNEGYKRFYTEGVKAYMQSINYPKNGTPAMSQRYVATFVADLHRTLLKGGIFFYPHMLKNGVMDTKGKLRMLYELMPLAFIVEQAGGLASNGQRALLDIQPTHVHMTQPVFIGSPDNVRECLDFLARLDFAGRPNGQPADTENGDCTGDEEKREKTE